jgi:methylenetetrahydrofolate dehydrogenase (NADP+)/methenyltetrahydrofolate cyclohydrolase
VIGFCLRVYLRGGVFNFYNNMATILDGKIVREKHTLDLKKKINSLPSKLVLAIIQIGNNPESNQYIGNKKAYAEEIGVQVVHVKLDEKVTEKEVIEKIQEFNNSSDVCGIIVQLPIPMSLDKNDILNSVDPSKDVDGLGAVQSRRLLEGRVDAITPATARGILSLLKFYNIPIEGKLVTVVGRSTLVGRPTAIAFTNHDATVTVCHSKTVDLRDETMRADILIVAIGKAHFIGQEHVRVGQIVIDVGINIDNSVLPNVKGDVYYDEVKDIVAAITPVPYGVGQMTVVSLFENLYDLFVSKKSE